MKGTWLLSGGVQSVSSLRRHARCILGKRRDFPDQSKNKHTPIAISEATDDWRMWKRSWNYGLVSKSGLGAISTFEITFSLYMRS